MQFEVHQVMYRILFGETRHHVVFMLPHTLDQVAGDTCIQCAVAFAGKNVYGRLFYNLPGFPPVRDRRISAEMTNSMQD